MLCAIVSKRQTKCTYCLIPFLTALATGNNSKFCPGTAGKDKRYAGLLFKDKLMSSSKIAVRCK